VLSSCREGTCGTCETPVLEGDVDHRDSILTPIEQAENTVMYICVSRAACPRLVLEL
jgi:ferredoxin